MTCTHYSLQEAIKGLQDLQALDLREYLTPLGYHLASLPVNVRIGKILLYGTSTQAVALAQPLTGMAC